MSGDVSPYIALLPSEHRDQPNFLATLDALLQPFADLLSVVNAIQLLYDIDQAVGEQLDVIGEWVGRSRQVRVPITGVYFSLDTSGVGFDEGVWLGPNDSSTGLYALPDDYYRLVLYVGVLNNVWDGSLNAAYQIYQTLFTTTPYTIFIVDRADLTMAVGVLGKMPDPLTLALLTQGYLSVKPAGVQLTAYLTPTVDNTPMFAFDMNTADFAGFDQGAWALYTAA